MRKNLVEARLFASGQLRVLLTLSRDLLQAVHRFDQRRGRALRFG